MGVYTSCRTRAGRCCRSGRRRKGKIQRWRSVQSKTARWASEVRWNEEYRWWDVRLAVATGRKVRLSVGTYDEEPREIPEGARRFIRACVTTSRASSVRRQSASWRSAARRGMRASGSRWPRVHVPHPARRATIYTDGSAGVYYQDGDLFAGYSIVVSVGADVSIADTDNAG